MKPLSRSAPQISPDKDVTVLQESKTGQRARCPQGASHGRRALAFTTQPQHLPYLLNPGLRYVVLTHPETGPCLPVGRQVCCFCSSARSFALRLPSDGLSQLRPCLRLVFLLYLKTLQGSHTGDFHPISSRPCRAYTNGCTGQQGASSMGWL